MREDACVGIDLYFSTMKLPVVVSNPLLNVSMDAFKFQVVCVVLNPPAEVVRNACTVACLTMYPLDTMRPLLNISQKALLGAACQYPL